MGGRHISRRRFFSCPTNHGFSFPPPAYAGIHPTLYLFGFRAHALNSHSPPSLPGCDPGPFWGFFLTVQTFEAGGAFQGRLRGFLGLRPPGASGSSGQLPQASRPLGASGGLRGLGQVWVGFGSGWHPERRPQAPQGQGRQV